MSTARERFPGIHDIEMNNVAYGPEAATILNVIDDLTEQVRDLKTDAEQELIEASIAMRAAIGSPFGPGINQHHGAFEAWQRFSIAELAVRKQR